MGSCDLTGAFKHESDGVAAVVGLDGDDVVVASAAKHLGHVVEVHAHGEITVAAVVLEALGSQKESNQCHVARVHGLEGEARGRAIEVGIVHQLSDRLQDLLQEAPLHQPQFQHLLEGQKEAFVFSGTEREEGAGDSGDQEQDELQQRRIWDL